MRTRVRGILALLLSGILVAGMAVPMAGAADVPRMSKDKLKSLLDDPGVVVIDVRVEGDWKSSSKKIKGAVRGNPADVETWMNDYPKDKTLVLYCA